jgi:hypothetical protein
MVPSSALLVPAGCLWCQINGLPRPGQHSCANIGGSPMDAACTLPNEHVRILDAGGRRIKIEGIDPRASRHRGRGGYRFPAQCAGDRDEEGARPVRAWFCTMKKRDGTVEACDAANCTRRTVRMGWCRPAYEPQGRRINRIRFTSSTSAMSEGWAVDCWLRRNSPSLTLQHQRGNSDGRVARSIRLRRAAPNEHPRLPARTSGEWHARQCRRAVTDMPSVTRAAISST